MKTLISIMTLYRISTFLAGCLGVFIFYAAPSFSLLIVGWVAVVPTFWAFLIVLHLFFIEPISEAWAGLRESVREYERSRQ